MYKFPILLGSSIAWSYSGWQATLSGGRTDHQSTHLRRRMFGYANEELFSPSLSGSA